MISLDLEDETPDVRLIAPDYGQGARLDAWLAQPAVQERLLVALQTAFKSLGPDTKEAA